MTTREEIEAAAKRRLAYLGGSRQQYHGGFIQREADGYTLSDAYLAERAKRQRRIEAAAIAICENFEPFFSDYDGPDLAEQIERTITRHLNGETT